MSEERTGFDADTALREARERSVVADGATPYSSVFVDDQVERTTFHDFALYEYAFEVWRPTDDRRTDTEQPSTPPTAETPPPSQYLPADFDDLQGLSDYAGLVVADFLDQVRAALVDPAAFDPEPIIALLVRFRIACEGELRRHYPHAEQWTHRHEQMLVFFIDRFLADLVGLLERMGPNQRRRFYEQHFDPAVVAWTRRAVALDMPWILGTGPTQDDYLATGYEVRELFGRSPRGVIGTGSQRRLEPAPDGRPGSEYLSVGGQEFCHEIAWDHARHHSSLGISTTVRAELVHAGQVTSNLGVYGGEHWFVARIVPNAQPGMTEERSAVLDGARDILVSGHDDPADAAEIEAEVRDVLDRYGDVLGTGKAVTDRERYGFQPYPEGSINFGLRVIYRQAWRPRGVQPGELVRTIPLGPGQTEKVSVRIQQRNRVTRDLEDVSATEFTQEVTSQTTSSSELVEQAASSRKWHIDHTGGGSFNLGPWGVNASTSVGFASEASRASTDSKKQLNEAVRKAAQVSRRETTVKVSTEREDTFERTVSSEISNPNQEIAVTYLYETVQRIYRVEASLESVEPVVFVGEHVPTPQQLSIAWVRRHDWILSRVLLEESFRDILELITTLQPDFAETLTAEALGLDDVRRLGRILNAAGVSLEQIHGLQGDVSNTYEATLRAYREAVERARELLAERQQQLARIRRLLDHLADNILHYCRAIWAAEDPERRTMRYASLRVPTRFHALVNTQNTATDPLTGQTIYTGQWVADPTSWTQLTKLIHPTGPIGFAGNYAICRVRRNEHTAGISRIVRMMNQAYFETDPPQVRVTPPDRAAALQVQVVIDSEDFYTGDRYVLRGVQRTPGVGGGLMGYRLFRRRPDGSTQDITGLAARVTPASSGLAPAGGLALQFDGLLLTVTGRLVVGDEIHLLPVEPRLIDPELKYQLLLEPHRPRQELEDELRADHTQDVVVDTTNLWLSLLPGDGSTLEPFKRRHRLLDVELATAELARRLLRLHAGELGDPDIDKQILISDRQVSLARGVAAAESAARDTGGAVTGGDSSGAPLAPEPSTTPPDGG